MRRQGSGRGSGAGEQFPVDVCEADRRSCYHGDIGEGQQGVERDSGDGSPAGGAVLANLEVVDG